MKKSFFGPATSSKSSNFFGSLWVLSIIGFIITLGLATNWFKSQVQHTTFGNSPFFLILFLGTFCLGFVSFVIFVVLTTTRILLKQNPLAFKKSFVGFSFFGVKLLFILAIFPLFLIYRTANLNVLVDKIKRKKFHFSYLKPTSIKSFVGRLVAIILISITLLPIWIGTYAVAGFIAAEQFGYVAKDLPIVGTGSMYPTWPKGSAGKESKELAKEIVATAGFLPYPNGIHINGKRFWSHTLGRGDIITWENSATRALTSRDGAEPSGLLKRLIGLPGDKIELKDGVVYLNDEPQKEPYIAKPRSTFGEKFLKECQPITVPEDKVFAMGDNRKGSADSREIGFAPIKDIGRVLPLFKQKGNLDKNWHDASKDLDTAAKPKINKLKLLHLLNQKRRENNAPELKYDTKLEKSASIRGEMILKYNDFEQKSYGMEKSMEDANYWNSYWWEVPIQGYYEAEELIEDYLERDTSDTKKTWFDDKFDDMGVAEIHGELNGCPTQIIVLHFAGYVPATYDPGVVASWKVAFDSLNSVIPGWEAIKGKNLVNDGELNQLLELFYRERAIASGIFTKMDTRQWLTKEDNKLMDDFNRMSQESNDLANKLNGK